MADVTVSIELDATPAAVWTVIEPVERHVDWMVDAVAIDFQTEQRRGTGTRFTCDTRVGPIRLTDHMEITTWRPPTTADATGVMGVRHRGLVTGTGEFRLEPRAAGGGTRFTWTEDLDFPWYLGGRIGAAIAGRVVLRRIWERNLGALARLVHGPAPPPT